MGEKKCWVCLRITPETVLKQAHTIWNKRQVARKIGLEASKIIAQAYQKNPIFFCGKKANSVLSGLFYLLGFRHNYPKTQREVSYALGVTDGTTRNSYLKWLGTFPGIFSEFQVEALRSTYPKYPRLLFRGEDVLRIYWKRKKVRDAHEEEKRR